MEIGYQKFFLGANSCEGFVSHFGDCYDITDGWRAYIIKGGPGTGKSSFMKFMAARAHDMGYSVVLCPCSSDPSSLDGIIIEDTKTVFLDGTAPHIVEPKLAGACEQLINLGEFWDSEALFERSGEILAATRRNSALHKTASGYLRAAGLLMSESLRRAADCTDTARVLGFADGLCQRKLPKKRLGKGREWVRFIGAVTPVGVIGYSKSTAQLCQNRVIVSDAHGSVSGIIMQSVRERALSLGYEIITLKNPFLPSTLIDHILIPELSLGFFTENPYITFDTPDRRIHESRFIDTEKQRLTRQRVRFVDRTARELILAACKTLSDAKASHDELEKYYIDAMDFAAVSLYAEEIAENL